MIELMPVRVGTGHADTHGRLAIRDDHLVAVLVRLDDPCHGEDCGRWFIEAGFGTLQNAGETFDDLHQARGWMERRLEPVEPAYVWRPSAPTPQPSDESRP